MKTKNEKRKTKFFCGFTLIEVAAALVILSIILTSVMVVMGQITQSMIDLSSQNQAFAIARQNLEELLSSNEVSDKSDFGILETNPDITWQTVVEPFYEPISKRMWIRGVCTAGYTDSKGLRQNVELSCWLTGLTAEQIKQILQQQKRLDKLLEDFSKTQEGQQVARQHQTNIAFLRYKGLDMEDFKAFIEQLERRRMDYIAQYGIEDEGYEDLADELSQEEFDFMYRQGVDYNELAVFYENYDPDDPAYSAQQILGDQAGQMDDYDQQQPGDGSGQEMDGGGMQLPDDLPPEFIEQLKDL